MIGDAFVRFTKNSSKRVNTPKMFSSTISRPVEIGLRAIGIWPGAYKLPFQILWTVAMGCVQTFQYRYIIGCLGSNNFMDLIDSVSTTLPYSLLCLKLIILWFNRGLFSKILKTMTNDWQECAKTESDLTAMTHKAILSHRCATSIISVYFMAVFLYVTAILELREHFEQDDSKPRRRKLFLKMDFPFTSNESPIYEIVMVTQCLHLLICASTIGLLDALIMTLVLHAGGQIDIIDRTLSEISNDGFNFSAATMKTLIRRHQRVIAFTENIENLFTYIALSQFITNTMVICSIGFVIVTSLGTVQGYTLLVKSFFFYVAITLEAFIFCFAGEYLSTKSKSIGDEAYKSLWYVLRPSESRILLLLILRSQRRLTITVGKFNDLSLEAFGDIMKASVSYVSVLSAMS